MRLSHLFHLDSINLSMPPHSWKGAIKELTQQLAQAGRLAGAEEARRDVESRELLGATALGHGVAVPHAATAGVNQPLIAYGRSRKGVNFHASDGQLVHHVFLLLGPPARQSLHLRILARLTRLLAQRDFRAALDAAQSPEDVLGAVQQYVGDFDEFEEPAGMPKVLVVGENEYAVAMAAHIALLGSRVALWGLDSRPLETIRAMRGITVEGAISGFAQFVQVGGELAEAAAGADLVMLALPANLHAALPERLGPLLREGQAVVLHPGRVGGCLEFAARLRALHFAPPVYLAEAQMIPYECELPGPAVLRVHRVQNAIPVATLPSFRLPDLLPLLSTALPYYTVGANSLAVGLGNVATFFQPAVTLLNTTRVERRRTRFMFYRDGVSPQMSRMLEALDAERVAVLEALGLPATTARQWLASAYGATGDSLHDLIQHNSVYRARVGPRTLDHVYLTECVPCGLATLVSLGAHLGLAMPTASALVHLAGVLLGRDFLHEGRTVEAMGLARLSAPEIAAMLEYGNGG